MRTESRKRESKREREREMTVTKSLWSRLVRWISPFLAVASMGIGPLAWDLEGRQGAEDFPDRTVVKSRYKSDGPRHSLTRQSSQRFPGALQDDPGTESLERKAEERHGTLEMCEMCAMIWHRGCVWRKAKTRAKGAGWKLERAREQ